VTTPEQMQDDRMLPTGTVSALGEDRKKLWTTMKMCQQFPAPPVTPATGRSAACARIAPNLAARVLAGKFKSYRRDE
jgi:hypothetical protein